MSVQETGNRNDAASDGEATRKSMRTKLVDCIGLCTQTQGDQETLKTIADSATELFKGKPIFHQR